MNKPGYLYNDTFWKILAQIDLLEGQEKLSVLASSLEVPNESIERGLIFLQQLNYPISLENKDGEQWIKKTGEAPLIKIQFSLLEWISLQAYFPVLAEQAEAPFYQILSKKLAEVEAKYQDYDLFSTAESLPLMSGHVDSSIVSIFNEYLPLIEESILKQNVLNITMNGRDKILLYPHRVVHLEAKLRIVGEDVNDHSLITFDMDFINEIQASDKEYKPNYTVIEVNEFISGFREVSGNEIRLILKIQREDEQLDLSPSYHFLGDPFITTNSSGETIWAASIEPCEDLMVWLAELGDRIEILDPLDFKEMVEEYKALNKPKAA
jgi:predicted DNA-binding transcriptional regulator YafY